MKSTFVLFLLTIPHCCVVSFSTVQSSDPFVAACANRVDQPNITRFNAFHSCFEHDLVTISRANAVLECRNRTIAGIAGRLGIVARAGIGTRFAALIQHNPQYATMSLWDNKCLMILSTATTTSA